MMHDIDIDRLRRADPAAGLPEEALAISRTMLVATPVSQTSRRPSRRLLLVGGTASAFALAAAAAIPALVSTSFGPVEHVQTVDDHAGRCAISAMLLRAGDDEPVPASAGTPARPGSVQGPAGEDEEGGAQMTIAAAYSAAGDAPSRASEDDFATVAEWFDAQDFDPVLREALDAAGGGTSWEDGDAAVASALQDIESRLVAAGVDPHGSGIIGVEIVCDVDAG